MNRPTEGASPKAWLLAWSSRSIRIEALVTVLILVGALVLYSTYLAYNESRPGVVLPDPFLDLFPARDATAIIFALIYGGVLLGIYSLVTHPRSLILALRTYTLLILVRIVAMYMVPLAPPEEMIPLYDPLAGLGPGDTLYRDLFFSGHTSTLFLLFLTAHGRLMRGLFLICTVAVGALVLLQHCHYTIDVLAAPFFAYGCYRMVVVASRKRDV